MKIAAVWRLAIKGHPTDAPQVSFTGTVRNGVIILPPEARLPEGTEVRVEPVELAPEQDAFLAAVERVAKPRPQWPADYPLNHGHYVSGEPRKP